MPDRRREASPRSVIHRSPYPDPRIPALALDAYVLERAGDYADRVALVDGVTEQTLTYGALARAVHLGASGLVAEGVRPGDVVALLGSNELAWAAGFHAILAAGAVALPINPMCTAEEIARLLDDSDARFVVASDAARDEALSASRLSHHQDVFTLDPSCEEGPFNEIPLATGGVPRLDQDTARAPAVIAYSSGTEGLPKRVLLTHRNLVANVEQHQPVQVIAPDEVFCAFIPFFHMYGLTLILNAALRNGGTVVTLPRFDIERYLTLIEKYRVTRLHLVPPVVFALAAYPSLETRDLSSVRVAVSGGAPLDAAVALELGRRVGFRVIQGYGMTEASPGTHYVPSDDRGAKVPAGSVGFLVPGTEARLVDPGTGVENEREGELWLRGPQITPGYLGAPEAAASALVDGWLRTGDVLRIDEHGAFFVVDRLKELIKYNSYEVAPAELEAVLRSHPQVADAAVVGLPRAPEGETPVAYVVAKGELDPAALVAWVAERVAPYKKIRDVRLVAEIPRSPSGKILRRILRERG